MHHITTLSPARRGVTDCRLTHDGSSRGGLGRGVRVSRGAGNGSRSACIFVAVGLRFLMAAIPVCATRGSLLPWRAGCSCCQRHIGAY